MPNCYLGIYNCLFSVCLFELIFVCLFIFSISDTSDFGCAGDWILILVHFMKYMRLQNNDIENSTDTKPSIIFPGNENGSLLFFIFVSALGSYVIYFSIGGFLHVSSN